MKMRQPARRHESLALREHPVGFCREPGNQVGTEDDVRPQPAGLVTEGNGLGAGVAPLHPLEDHVVARLQAEMQMGHQT